MKKRECGIHAVDRWNQCTSTKSILRINTAKFAPCIQVVQAGHVLGLRTMEANGRGRYKTSRSGDSAKIESPTPPQMHPAPSLRVERPNAATAGPRTGFICRASHSRVVRSGNGKGSPPWTALVGAQTGALTARLAADPFKRLAMVIAGKWPYWESGRGRGRLNGSASRFERLGHQGRVLLLTGRSRC